MTNAAYQEYRIRQYRDSIIAKLQAMVHDYYEQEGVEAEFAVRDILTDLRHICDVHGLDFADIDKRAHKGYTEEVAFSAEQDIPDVVLDEAGAYTGL